jgi:hypothetical protein
MNNPEPTWVKSSYSSQGNCVEVAARDHVLVRDTEDRSGPCCVSLLPRGVGSPIK